MTFKLYWFT